MRYLLMTAMLIGVLVHAGQVRADAALPYAGMRQIDKRTPFGAYVKNLKATTGANTMGIVAHACASCGAENIGVTIPGNHVVMIYHPRFAVRMLRASAAAGIEAPLRLYVTESAAGTARPIYRLSSRTFGAFKVPALDVMAREPDTIIARFVSDAG